MITVFTSSYNYGRYLRTSIESVLNQTYKDFEYHLIDYGSTDDTWKIMQGYKDPRIKAIQIGKQVNKAFAMNHSIRISRGDFWVWCPADDYFHETLLRRSREYSRRYPGAVLYSDNYTIDDNGRQYMSHIREEFTDEQLKKEIWKRSVIGFTGIFIPMRIFRDTGLYFPEDENYSEDYCWMIQAVMQGVKFRHIPEKLHYKRKHKGSSTNREYKELVANIKVIHERLRREGYADK